MRGLITGEKQIIIKRSSWLPWLIHGTQSRTNNAYRGTFIAIHFALSIFRRGWIGWNRKTIEFSKEVESLGKTKKIKSKLTKTNSFVDSTKSEWKHRDDSVTTRNQVCEYRKGMDIGSQRIPEMRLKLLTVVTEMVSCNLRKQTTTRVTWVKQKQNTYRTIYPLDYHCFLLSSCYISEAQKY